MVKHVLDLGWGYPGEGEGRNRVFREEIYGGGFEAQLWGATGERAEEEKFIGMEGKRRMVVEVVVVDGGELFYFGFVAGFFADLAEGGDAGCVADVGPAAGEGPGVVGAFFDEEDAVFVEHSRADVDLWSGVAEVIFKESDYGVCDLGIVGRGENFGGDLADLFEAFDVERIFGVG